MKKAFDNLRELVLIRDRTVPRIRELGFSESVIQNVNALRFLTQGHYALAFALGVSSLFPAAALAALVTGAASELLPAVYLRSVVRGY